MSKTTKVCTKCKRELPLDQFHKSKKSKDGHVECCKECKSQIDKEYREKNKDKLKETRRQYRENNKDEIAKRKKEYYENNKERISGSKKGIS